MNDKHASERRILNRGLLFSLCIGLGACEQLSEKTPLEHIDKALEYRTQGDLRSSAIELKAALKQNPDLMLARQLLGELYLTQGDPAAAEKELTHALELGAVKDVILPTLAESLLLQRKYQQILDQMNPSDLTDQSARADLMTYRGDAWLGMSKPEKARGEYEEALAVNPDTVLAKVGLARLDAAKQNFDNALKLLGEAIATSPEEARAYSLQAEVYASKGENDKAEESYGKAIQFGRLSQMDRANRAVLRFGMNKVDAAAEDVQVLKKEAPNSYLTHFAEGLLALSQGKFPEAQSAFEASLKANDRYLRTYYFLGDAHLRQNHLSQAEENFTYFLAAFPGSIKARQMLALTKLQLKDFSGAKALLSPLLQELPNDGVSRELMGAIELAMGNNPVGIDHLRKLIELRPESATARVNLGQALLKQGAAEAAVKEFEHAVDMDPTLYRADIALISAFLKEGKFDKALESAQKLEAKWPESATPLNLIGTAYSGKKMETEAREAFEKSLKLARGNPVASQALAAMAESKGDFKKAESYYQQALDVNPAHLGILLLDAQLKQKQGDLAGTKKLLESAMEKNPEALEPRIILADNYLKTGQPEKAMAVTREMQKKHPNNPLLLRLIGEAQLNAGESSNAVSTLEKLVPLVPKSAQAHYLLAKSYAEVGEPKKMRSALDKALELDPNHEGGQAAKIRLLMLEGKLDEAEKLLHEFGKAHRDTADLFELKAMLALAQKRPDHAIATYGEARKHFPDSNQWVLRSAQVQWQNGSRESAVSSLDEWLTGHSADDQVRYVLSTYYLLLDRQDSAKVQLGKLHEKFPKNIFVLNSLAWLLRSENPKLALDYARAALELAPQDPAVMDTLGAILLGQGQTVEGLHYLEKASDKSPMHPIIQFHLAEGLVQKGDKGRARDVLMKALASKQSFPDREKAQAMLDGLEE